MSASTIMHLLRFRVSYKQRVLRKERFPSLTTEASLGNQQVAPGSSVEFYKAALDESGGLEQTSGWVRLFMAPGMAHCSGGEGPDTFDKIGLIEQWVERGKAPEQIIAAHKTAGKTDRTRPLCPYPQVAHYDGAGNIDEASNFSCRLPK